MKTLLTSILILGFSGLSLQAQDKPARLAGTWEMSVATPHGNVPGTLKVTQDGAKISGTCELDMFGSGAVAGSVEGKKITFSLGLHNGEMKLTFTGTVDGDKMSGTTAMQGQGEGHGGQWSATRKQSSVQAPAAPAKSVVGTVTGFKSGTQQLGVRPDGGAPLLVKFGVDTEVVSVPVGERDLKKAAPAAVSDIVAGDRVLVSFVDGISEARRVLVMPASEIARRDEKDRQDWRQRGVSGTVMAASGNEIDLGAVKLVVTEKTVFRRYSSDTVKFGDAKISAFAAIETGDQVRARGVKSEDGSKLFAEEVVSGRFVSKLGPITEANPHTGEITIQDVVTKSPVTIRVTADSKLKMLPDMAHMLAQMPAANHQGATRRIDMTSMLEELAPATFEDLKVGSAVMVSCAQDGSKIPAISLLANADFVLKMMQPGGGHGGASADVEAMRKMHGMDGSHTPTMMSMPAFVQ